MLVSAGVVVVILLSAGVAFGVAQRNAWRWGEVEGAPVQVGEGAFRAAPVRGREPRGVPRVVPWAAFTGFVWAALTMVVFAPAGALLAVIQWQDRGSLLAAGVGLVALSGLALGAALVVAGVGLSRCRPGAHEVAGTIATWSLVHHAAVLGVMLAQGLALTPSVEGFLLFAVSFVPCTLGVLQALLLRAAAAVPGPAVVHDGTDGPHDPDRR